LVTDHIIAKDNIKRINNTNEKHPPITHTWNRKDKLTNIKTSGNFAKIKTKRHTKSVEVFTGIGKQEPNQKQPRGQPLVKPPLEYESSLSKNLFLFYQGQNKFVCLGVYFLTVWIQRLSHIYVRKKIKKIKVRQVDLHHLSSYHY